MTGLLVLLLFSLWVWGVFRFARWIGDHVQGGRWRWPVVALAFVALLPLPVADELIARPQIERLCRDGAVFKIDEQNIRGRRVKSFAEPLNEAVPGIAIPVTFTRTVYRDESSGEELATLGYYYVKGGALVRTLGFSESSSPMFVRSYCAPNEGGHEAANRLGFKIIN
jgi:hypothetical protein